MQPWKAMSVFSVNRSGFPSTRPAGSRSVEMRRTGAPSQTISLCALTSPFVPHTSAYSRLALPTGQASDWMARVMVKSFCTI